MGKRVAILQSNYIPWKGYFDLIDLVDEFIVYDAVQYTRRDWRNRNKIKTKDGLQWLTIPVLVKGKFLQRIDETELRDASWIEEHLAAISHAYARAPHFRKHEPWLKDLYRSAPSTTIAAVNLHFLRALCERLNITTPLVDCTEYALVEGQTERLVSLCVQAGATEYISGPAARAYIDPVRFSDANITLRYKSYAGYEEYPQQFPPFEHGVTILDVLFNEDEPLTRYLQAHPRIEGD
jgi:hypothetical protein